MLITEWNTEEAKEVWFEEGMERGMAQGMEKGRTQGHEMATANIAMTALAEGLSVDVIKKITGLDVETIRNLTP